MAYSDFTLAKLRQQFGLTIRDNVNLFQDVPAADVPPTLATLLARQAALALRINTEKARSELITAPILLEIKFAAGDRVAFFSGVDFPVDSAAGLNGRCDFLLARNPGQLDVNAPVCVVVEAKNENLIPGIPQAIAAMVAARRFNEQAGAPIDPIYGAVTTGNLWRFLTLTGDTASVDPTEFTLVELGRIYAILTRMALGE